MTNKHEKMLFANYRKQLVKPFIRRREFLAFGQEELNTLLGLPVGRLQQWENGSIFPEMTEMQNWLEALGMELVIIPQH